MQDLKDALDQLEPTRDEAGDWERVVHDARGHGRLRLARPVAVAAAAAALFGLVLFQPWESESPTVLERALAAVEGGPVIHVVLRGEWGGTLVDLKTGDRRPVHGENEIWYDPDRRALHSVSLMGGVVQYEEIYEPRDPPDEIAALGREYREALESGSARVAGEGAVDGVRVAWITFRSEMLPDVADARDHEWAQQVAVSLETFKPVALRDTRDGEPGPNTLQRVLELEMLPAGEGDFTASKGASLDGRLFNEGREPIELEQAAQALGQTPFWLGPEHARLSLTRVFRNSRSNGRRREIRLTGTDAQAAERCSKLKGEPGGRCFRALGRPLVVRPDGVFTYVGPTVWEQEETGVTLFYGAVGDDPSTYRKDSVPLLGRAHVQITETTRPSAFVRGVGRYVPPGGSVFVAAGNRTGIRKVGGVYVLIQASSEELILSAARALEPMP